MVILSNSSTTTQQHQHQQQIHSLPSPARGSPPGISPNSSNLNNHPPSTTRASYPEPSGLELMFQGWRRQAAKKAEQFRQRELNGEARRQKEQNEINEVRMKIIHDRMKKLEQQQQSTSKARNNSSALSDSSMEQSRKRRSDDEFYLGTPSDGGFSCDSPDATFGVAVDSGYPKSAKLEKPTSTEKNASVFIETFQLPPPPPHHHQQQQMTPKMPVSARPMPQMPSYPIVGGAKPQPQPIPPQASSHFDFDPMTAMQHSSTISSNPCTQQISQPNNGHYHQQHQQQQQQNPMGDMLLSQEFEEAVLRSLPSDLDSALTPDLLSVIEDLEWPLASNSRAPTAATTTTTPRVQQHQPPPPTHQPQQHHLSLMAAVAKNPSSAHPPTSSSTNPSMQYAAQSTRSMPPTHHQASSTAYSSSIHQQQQYPAVHQQLQPSIAMPPQQAQSHQQHQQQQQQQQYYANMMANRAWHQQQQAQFSAQTAPINNYATSNPYAMQPNGVVGHNHHGLMQQVPRGWQQQQQGMSGNSSTGFNPF